MKEIIFAGFLFVLIFGTGYILGEYNSQNIPNTPKSEYTYQEYICDLNACTHRGTTCEGWKCLCDTHTKYGYSTGYCQDYETYCVSNLCRSITIRVDGVHFIKHSVDYTKCVMIYDKTILLNIIETGIELKDIDQNTFECLAEFRNNMSVPDAYVFCVMYENGRFYDGDHDRINC